MLCYPLLKVISEAWNEDINDLEHICIVMVVKCMKAKKNKVFAIICSTTGGATKRGSRTAPDAIRGTGWLPVAFKISNRNHLSVQKGHLYQAHTGGNH
jgi:hypothetical protein